MFKLSKPRRVLLTMMIVGALSTLGATTWAGFNATAANPGNIFGNATITLTNVGDQVNWSRGACTSSTYNGTSSGVGFTGNCGTLTYNNLTPSTPASAVQSYTLITYTGTLPTSQFRVSLANPSTNTGAGTCSAANPATGLQFEVIQTDAAGNNPIQVYPAAAGAWASAATLETLNNPALSGAYIPLYPFPSAGGPALTLERWAQTNSSRLYLKYYLDNAVAVDNTWQGCQVKFDLQFIVQ